MTKTFSRSTFLVLKVRKKCMGSLSLATQNLAYFDSFVIAIRIHSKYKPFLITMAITILKIVN